MTIDLYRTPLLTARETARYLKMPESTLNAWLAVDSDEPLVHAVRPERRGWPRVPFVGIVEAHVLRALRAAGMPMDEIRRAAAIVRAEFDDPFALAKRRIATDGVAVFIRLADESLIRARDHQQANQGCPREPPARHRLGRHRHRHPAPTSPLPLQRRGRHRPSLRLGIPGAHCQQGEGRGRRRTLAHGRTDQRGRQRVRPDGDRRRGCPPTSRLSSSSTAASGRPRQADCVPPGTSSTSSPSTTRAMPRRSATPNGSPKAAVAAGPPAHQGPPHPLPRRRTRRPDQRPPVLPRRWQRHPRPDHPALPRCHARHPPRGSEDNEIGFWHIHLGGRITRMWP